jgi:putative addiction module component (TIGR02574 family)
MKTAVIRKKLHEFVDSANDQQITALYLIFEDEIAEKCDPWEDAVFFKELESRINDIESGKTKGIPWEEVRRKARERLASKK